MAGDRLPPAPRRPRARRASPTTRSRRELVERAAGAGARLRRAAHRREGARGVRAHRRRGGDARARLARQPLALRAAARAARGRAHHGEVVAELRWVIEQAEDHLGVERAGRYLRKFYPWYADALGLPEEARIRARAHRPTRPPRGRFLDRLRSGSCGANRPPDRPRYAPALVQTRERSSVFMARERSFSPRGPRGAEGADRAPLADRPARGRRSASRRRASSATSPRTRSTTTPRTSRRCSRSRSPSSRTSCGRLDRDRRDRRCPHRRRLGRLDVHVKDQKTDKSTKYKIVGSAEANPAESKLSNESPVGKALIGTSAATSSRCRCRAVRSASSRSPRSKRANARQAARAARVR